MALTKVSRGLLSTSIVDNGNATAITIDSSENVGIGTGTPGCKVDLVAADNTSLSPTLRVNSNNVAVNAALAYDGLVGSGEFELRTSGASALKFGTNATERMRIDSSGNLLVGKTSSDLGATAGIELNGQYDVGYFTRSGDKPLVVNRLSSDGTIADFRKDGSSVGSIGSKDSNIFIGTGDTGVRFSSGTDSVFPIDTSTGNGRDAAVDLGLGSGGRFKDLYLSGGAYLGGTAAANKLDDYEEGTWTGSATAGASTALTVADEKYTKIGNQVTIQCTINFSGASGTLYVSGLPFASSPAAVGIGREDATSGYAVYCRVASSDTTIHVFYAGGVSNATPFQVSAGNMRISMTYLT
jgi:hypothetical protein